MKKFINFRLILFLAVSCCLGIAAAYFFICKDFLFFSVCIFPVALIVVGYSLYVFIKGKRKLNLIFPLLLLLLFTFGGTNFFLRVNDYMAADLGNHYLTIVGRITAVKDTDYGNYLALTDVSVEGNVNSKLSYNVAVYVYGTVDYDVGDVVFFKSTLKDKSIFYDGNFSSYDVQRRIKYTANVNAEDVFFVAKSPTIFDSVNAFIRNALSSGYSQESFNVGYAMLTGNDEYIEPETLSSYRQAGVAHIFAVSGLHIGFVATALGFVLDKLRCKRLLKVLITIPVLLFYSGVCGFSASSLRATVMCAVLLSASVGGEKYDKLTSLSLSALIVLAISPVELLCAGFQLSFGVVFGMFVLTQPVSKLLRFLPLKINNAISAVLAAQISGIPISLMVFGQFSAISVIANMILIPVVGIVFIAVWISIMLSSIFNAAAIVAFLPDKALWLINLLITAFDYGRMMVGGFSMGAFAIFYYLSIIVIGGYVNIKGVLRYCTAALMVVICVVGSTICTVKERDQAAVYVSGSDSVCATVIKDGQYSVLIVSDVAKSYSLSRVGRILSRINEDKLDLVIFTSGYYVNYQAFLSELNEHCQFDEIYYFGDRNEYYEIAVLKSFPFACMYNAKADTVLSKGTTTVKFGLDGYLVDVKVKSKNVAVLSCFSDQKVDYATISKNYYLMVARSMAESVFAASKPENAISYLATYGLADAETNGNVKYLIY